MVQPYVRPQLPKSEVKVKENIFKAEVVEEHSKVNVEENIFKGEVVEAHVKENQRPLSRTWDSRWPRSTRLSTSTCNKASQYQQGSSRPSIVNADPTPGRTDVRRSAQARPRRSTALSGISIFSFGMIPRTLPEPLSYRAKTANRNVVLYRQGSRVARLRDEMRQASDTQEYPSLIEHFWRTPLFDRGGDERLRSTGEYPKDEINALARGGKLRGHIPGVGRVLPSRATSRPYTRICLRSLSRAVLAGSGGCGDDEESGDDEDDDGESTRLLTRIAPLCRSIRLLEDLAVLSFGFYSPVTIPQRHVAGDRFGDRFPQRHVAGENPEMSLGKTPIVVVEVKVEENIFKPEVVEEHVEKIKDL
ncbi:hypothetical protein Tco_1458140 [Tanacetum coccineum]